MPSSNIIPPKSLMLTKFINELCETKTLGAKQKLVNKLLEKDIPFVEDINGDRKNKLVTFIWQGDLSSSPPKKIYLIGEFTPGYPDLSEQCRFINIPGTDIHFCSLTLPSNLNSSYEICMVDENGICHSAW